MPRFTRTRQARLDLIEAWQYIALDDADAADRVLDSLDAACALLAANPMLGPARDDIRPGLRYFVSGSWLILYRTVEDGVEIVRVVHGKRDLNGLF
jgi:toxin ParE1/3/4